MKNKIARYLAIPLLLTLGLPLFHLQAEFNLAVFDGSIFENIRQCLEPRLNYPSQREQCRGFQIDRCGDDSRPYWMQRRCKIIVLESLPCFSFGASREMEACLGKFQERWDENPDLFIEKYDDKTGTASQPPRDDSEEISVKYRADETYRILQKAVDYGTLINAKADAWVVVLERENNRRVRDARNLADAVSNGLTDLRVSTREFRESLEKVGGGLKLTQQNPGIYFVNEEERVRQVVAHMWKNLVSIRRIGTAARVAPSFSDLQEVLNGVNHARALQDLPALMWRNLPPDNLPEILMNLRTLREQVIRDAR